MGRIFAIHLMVLISGGVLVIQSLYLLSDRLMVRLEAFVNTFKMLACNESAPV